MKFSLAIALVFFSVFSGVLSSSVAQARNRTLLNCSAADQIDFQFLKVLETPTSHKEETLELVLMTREGAETKFEITTEDYGQGWIPLPDIEGFERNLIRQENGWEIFTMIGKENVFAPARCSESMF